MMPWNADCFDRADRMALLGCRSHVKAKMLRGEPRFRKIFFYFL